MPRSSAKKSSPKEHAADSAEDAKAVAAHPLPPSSAKRSPKKRAADSGADAKAVAAPPSAAKKSPKKRTADSGADAKAVAAAPSAAKKATLMNLMKKLHKNDDDPSDSDDNSSDPDDNEDDPVTIARQVVSRGRKSGYDSGGPESETDDTPGKKKNKSD